MKRLVIIGAGFAGLWSALSAVRLLDANGVGADEVEVTVVAPRASLDLRPRFYEEGASTMTAPLADLFDAVGVRFIAGTVETIDTAAKAIDVIDGEGRPARYSYDRLVLASGSRVARPDIPGLAEHARSIDQLEDAAAFEAHLRALAGQPDTPARATAVVIGAGFTGIELATELPARMRAILGAAASVRVVLVERATEIGPGLGAGPRLVIVEALASQKVECRLGAAVAAIDAAGVTLASGERIASLTVVWTGGLRASPLTAQIAGERDELGRLRVERDLRVPGVPDVFATGDTAHATTDDAGNYALMSCQHALGLGRFAGNNAAADLLGLATLPYRQERYVTCLDLGPHGSVVTEGWERAVQLVGPAAKEQKRFINGVLIAPPPPVRAEALALADPAMMIAPPS